MIHADEISTYSINYALFVWQWLYILKPHSQGAVIAHRKWLKWSDKWIKNEWLATEFSFEVERIFIRFLCVWLLIILVWKMEFSLWINNNKSAAFFFVLLPKLCSGLFTIETYEECKYATWHSWISIHIALRLKAVGYLSTFFFVWNSFSSFSLGLISVAFIPDTSIAYNEKCCGEKWTSAFNFLIFI